jgi:hypothetical protein
MFRKQERDMKAKSVQERKWNLFLLIFKGDFSDFSYCVRYSILLHLLPLRFHCVRGCEDRTQDCWDFGIDNQTF